MEENEAEDRLEGIEGMRKYDVFISYSRYDKKAVTGIKEYLEEQGFSCWMDLDGIESGSQEFSEDIINAIDASSAMLFFLSAESQKSKWAIKEIDYATDEHKHVVIVRLNDDAMTKKFRFNFKRADIIDWRDLSQRGKLLGDLKAWALELGQRLSVEAYEFYSQGKYTEAASLSQESAKRGNADGQYLLGWMYYYGYGVQQDYVMAERWSRRAAERGHKEAQYNLGRIYERGHGVENNYVEAVRWYRAAAEQGCCDAQCDLGRMYELGRGTGEKDEAQALTWYRMAANRGHREARNRLAKLLAEKEKRPLHKLKKFLKSICGFLLRLFCWMLVGAVVLAVVTLAFLLKFGIISFWN